MKYILSILLTAFALMGYAQSTVDLRGDSIRIFKQGGFAEMVLRNRTKDSTGGVLYNVGNGITKFQKSRFISSTQLVIGGDTVTISGGGGGSQSWDQTLNIGATNAGKIVIFDTAYTISSTGSGSHINMQWKPIRQGDGTPDFYFNLGATRYSGVSQADNIMNFGWNLTGGGGQAIANQPGIGMQFEQRYIPVVGDTNTEAHLFYIGVNGAQHRLQSFTVKEYLGSVTEFHTASTFDIRKFENDSIWFALQYHSLAMTYLGDTWSLVGDANGLNVSKNRFKTYDGSTLGDDIIFNNNFKRMLAPGSILLGGSIGSHNADAGIQFQDSLGTVFADINAFTDKLVIQTENGSTNPIDFKPGNNLEFTVHTDKLQSFVPMVIGGSPFTPIAIMDLRNAGVIDVTLYAENLRTTGTNYSGIFTTSGTGASENRGIDVTAAGAATNKGIRLYVRDTLISWSLYADNNAPMYHKGWVQIGETRDLRPREALDIFGSVIIDSLKSGANENQIVGWNTTSHALTSIVRLIGTGTLDFGSTAAGASTDLTITVTGAVDGDQVYIGVPNGSTLSNGLFTAWVSAADTVTVRFTNPQSVGALDPASGTFTAQIVK